MPPKKGTSNNPNGRKPGVPNKLTASLREIISDFLKENIEKVKDDFSKLDSKDRVKLYIDLLQFSIPKIQSVNMELDQKPAAPFTINVLTEETKKMIESGKFFEVEQNG